MTILLELGEVESQRLQELALTLKVDAKELVRAAINDFVFRPAEDFDRAVQYVPAKNRELYRRLLVGRACRTRLLVGRCPRRHGQQVDRATPRT